MVTSNLGLLEREAVKACEFRGHSMTPFTSFSETRAVASCWSCHMEVEVNAKPLPNEIDIGGEAVALNCEGKRRRFVEQDLRDARQALRDRLYGG